MRAQANPSAFDACFVPNTPPELPLRDKRSSHDSQQGFFVQFPKCLIEACPHSQNLAPTWNPYGILARLQQLPMDPRSVHDIIPLSKKRTRRRGRRGGKHHKINATERRQEEEYSIQRLGGSHKHTSEQHLNDKEVQAEQQTAHIGSAKYSSAFPQQDGYYSWAPQLRPDKLITPDTALNAGEGFSLGPATPYVEQNLYSSHGSTHPAARDLNGNYTLQSLCPGAASRRTHRLKPETHCDRLLTQRQREVAKSVVHYRAELQERKPTSLSKLSSSMEEATRTLSSATTRPHNFLNALDTTLSLRAVVPLSTALDKTPSFKTLHLGQESPIIFVPPTPTPTSFFPRNDTGLQPPAPSQQYLPGHSFYKSFTPSGCNTTDGARSMPCRSLPNRNSMQVASDGCIKHPLFPTRLVKRKLTIDPPTSRELQDLEDFLNCGHGSPCWCDRHIPTQATPSSSGNTIDLSESMSSQQTPTTSATDLDKPSNGDITGSGDGAPHDVEKLISSPLSLGPSSPFDDFEDFLHPSESESDEWTIVPSDAQNEPFHTRSFHEPMEEDDGGILSPSSFLLSPVLKYSEAELREDSLSPLDMSLAASLTNAAEVLEHEKADEPSSKTECRAYLAEISGKDWPTLQEAAKVK